MLSNALSNCIQQYFVLFTQYFAKLLCKDCLFSQECIINSHMSEQESGQEISSALPDPSLQDEYSRLVQLSTYFLDIANSGDGVSPETLEYIRGGGNLRLCLNEIEKLSPPCDDAQHVLEARRRYMRALLDHPVVRHHEPMQHRQELESDYINAVTSRVEAVVDGQTPEDALAVRQMPTLVEQTTFDDQQPSTLEDLAANHLYILVDTVLREHAHRRRIIDKHQAETRSGHILGSRVLRMTLAGSVFAASVSPRLHVIPIENEEIAHNVELGLEMLAATVFGWEAPEVIRSGYLDRKHNRRTAKLHEQMASDRRLSDLALRMAYSSTRYGGLHAVDTVTNRSGTDDLKENLRRFDILDTEFLHLNNDPGGKPYTGDQALGYAARLLIERRDQLDDLIDLSKSPVERKSLFLDLTKEILQEDLLRMRKGLNVSRFRRAVMRVAGIVPAVLFPGALSAAGEAATLSRDTVAATMRTSSETKT